VLFNSYTFIFAFLPASVCAYYLAGRFGGRRVAAATLSLVSLFFYGWWNPQSLWVLLTSIAVNACFISVILGFHNGSWPRRLVLIFGLVFNVGLLGFFKYAHFFVQTFNDAFGTTLSVAQHDLPLGISFFTFQKIAFLVDIYVGTEASFDLLYYCLFVSFFPPLIAGPIVHYRQIVPQFKESPLHPQLRNFAIGVSIFVIGLFKKCILADLSAGWANPAFEAASKHVAITSVDAWIGTLAYTFQIYFDFSGYSDMAIGLARLFGFILPVNFLSPYKSFSIIEFWRRWHITLSLFLRDYLYIPLGGSRRGSLRRNVNLMTTMLLGGLWHGAGWTFIAWGAVHATLLVANHIWRSARERLRLAETGWAGNTLCWALTFIAVATAWVLFRADTLETAASIIQAMYGLDGQASLRQFATYYQHQRELIHGLDWTNSSALWLSLVALVAFVAPNVYEMFDRERPALIQGIKLERPALLRWSPSLAWATVIPILFTLSVLRLHELSPFIYFQF
jgi:alginate O-acetyltransferase complex protein AlgI